MTASALAGQEIAQPAKPLLRLEQISKSFGQTKALYNVSLSLHAGQVHALIGQNGSGKSTLIKILAGYHQPDEGARAEIGGQPTSFPVRQTDLHNVTLGFVHQDLGLVDSLSVVDNLRIGSTTGYGRWRLIHWREERSAAHSLLSGHGLEIDVRLKVGQLSRVQKAQLAIVRALSGGADGMLPQGAQGSQGGMRRPSILVLDEPTAFLPPHETETLFGFIHQVARSGGAVLLVSHYLEEVRANCDTITILRDGVVANTGKISQFTKEEMVAEIVGSRSARAGQAKPQPPSAPPAACTAAGRAGARDAGFTLMGLAGSTVGPVDLAERWAGEVIGVTGIVGSGFEELPYLIFGDRSATAGEVRIGSTRVPAGRIRIPQMVRLGLGLVPADRMVNGCVGTLSVEDNVLLLGLDKFRAGPFLNRRKMRRQATAAVQEFGVRPARRELGVAALSGGNQQKVLLAKWLMTKPRVLLLHEPTQGVDVGAREEIYSLLDETKAGGTTLLVVSNDYAELGRLCDRVLVFSGGRVAGELRDDEINENRIARACLGDWEGE